MSDPVEQLRGYLARHKAGDLYALKAARQLLRRFGLTIRSPTKRRQHEWTAEQVALLREMYPDTPMPEIERRLGLPLTIIYAKATRLGLRRSASYLASPHACRLRRGGGVGAEHRFPKGNVPANKGQRRPGFAPGRMRETQFKKGRPANQSHNYVPIGAEKVEKKNGYLVRKVTDDPAIAPVRRWVAVHRLVWEAANGPVPPGHAIAFVGGRRTAVRDEITLDRLELVSQAEMMRRNTIHNLPKPLVEVIQLRGAINRQIRKKERQS
jgi:hypothetical protein